MGAARRDEPLRPDRPVRRSCGACRGSLVVATAEEQQAVAAQLREGVSRAGAGCRPATQAVSAAVWGDVNPALLDWLQVARRHVLDGAATEGRILLDLPDYDSVEAANRAEVERVIELVDLLMWVVDPQKYVDAVLHDRNLKRLTGHRDSMLVVLGQADRLDAAGWRRGTPTWVACSWPMVSTGCRRWPFRPARARACQSCGPTGRAHGRSRLGGRAPGRLGADVAARRAPRVARRPAGARTRPQP